MAMQHEEYLAWLAGLRPGDQVVVHRSVSGADQIQIMEVRRRTSTQIILGPRNRPTEKDAYRIRASRGDAVEGAKDRYFAGRTHIQPYTEEVKLRLRLRRIEARARDLGLRLSRNVIIPPQYGIADVEELVRVLDTLQVAMDAVDQFWTDRRAREEKA